MRYLSVLAGIGLGFGSLLGFAAMPASEAAASTFVSAANPTLTAIGTLVGGTTYKITATGIADLISGFNGGAGATFDADGKPTYAFPGSLGSLYPDGSDTDPQTGFNGAAGPGKLLGALVGTFSPAPTDYSQVFTIGTSLIFKASADATLFAIVNDDYYPNNDPFSGYTVAISTVPLPSALPSFGAAFVLLGAVGMVQRRKRRCGAEQAAGPGRSV